MCWCVCSFVEICALSSRLISGCYIIFYLQVFSCTLNYSRMSLFSSKPFILLKFLSSSCFWECIDVAILLLHSFQISQVWQIPISLNFYCDGYRYTWHLVKDSHVTLLAAFTHYRRLSQCDNRRALTNQKNHYTRIAEKSSCRWQVICIIDIYVHVPFVGQAGFWCVRQHGICCLILALDAPER